MRYSETITVSASSLAETGSLRTSFIFKQLYIADFNGWVLAGSYPSPTSSKVTGFRWVGSNVMSEQEEHATMIVCGFSDSLLGSTARASGNVSAIYGTDSWSSGIWRISVFDLVSASPKSLNCMGFPSTYMKLRPDNSFGENPPNGTYRLNVEAGGRTIPLTIIVDLP